MKFHVYKRDDDGAAIADCKACPWRLVSFSGDETEALRRAQEDHTQCPGIKRGAFPFTEGR